MPPRRAELRLARDAALIRLRERQRDLRAALDEVATGGAADDEHDPDGSPLSLQRMLATALVSHAEADLDALEDALGRLSSGRYGRCERCGAMIAPARLAAQPAARECVACAERATRSTVRGRPDHIAVARPMTKGQTQP